jgi:hypothetical protein
VVAADTTNFDFFCFFFVWINMRMVCLSTSIRSWANFELGIFLALYGQGLKCPHFLTQKLRSQEGRRVH